MNLTRYLLDLINMQRLKRCIFIRSNKYAAFKTLHMQG